MVMGRTAAAERLPARPDQNDAREHLGNSLERGERRRAPQPLANREAAQVESCHQQEKDGAEREGDCDLGWRRRPREHHHAIKSRDYSGHERHFDDRGREPLECGRLANADCAGETLPESLAVLARDEIAHSGNLWLVTDRRA